MFKMSQEFNKIVTRGTFEHSFSPEIVIFRVYIVAAANLATNEEDNTEKCLLGVHASQMERAI